MLRLVESYYTSVESTAVFKRVELDVRLFNCQNLVHGDMRNAFK
jgi:hypothetical protein